MTSYRNLTLAAALVLALALVSGTAAYAEEPNQIKCPVLGSPANKKVYTDYQGKRIYFCCPPCIPQFKKNPEKYMKQLEKEGVILEDAPSKNKS